MPLVSYCPDLFAYIEPELQNYEIYRRLKTYPVAPERTQMRYKHIQVTPVGSPLGARVTGIDLTSRLTDQIFSEVKQAFLNHLLLIFPDQDISPEALRDFGLRFGTLNIHPFLPNMDEIPEILVLDKKEDAETNVGNGWHSDMTFLKAPPLGAMLHAKIIPPTGGDTLFCDMHLVYESLSTGLRKLLDKLTAVHDYTIIFRKSVRSGRTRITEDELEAARSDYPLVEHPVIRTHPDTGRKMLFVNPFFTSHFVGMTPDESKPLLDYLFSFAGRPEFTYRYVWEEKAIAFWDNRCTQHYAVNDYGGNRRLMHRITIDGDRPH